MILLLMLLLDLEHKGLALDFDLNLLPLPPINHAMNILHILPRVSLYVLLNTDKSIEVCLVTICR